jgi:predicted Zn-dependent protease with MMP-like domain
MVHVKVLIPPNRSIEIELEPSQTISHLKQVVFDLTMVSPAHRVMLYEGAELADTLTIEAARIPDRAGIYYVQGEPVGTGLIPV